MDLAQKHVLIVGAKRSGIAAARLLRRRGVENVSVMDSAPLTSEERARFDELSAIVVPQSEENLLASDLVVVSPGVPADLPMLNAARRRSIPVIGEVELASFFLQGPVIGVTGSNGKTTTTSLIGHLLQESGIACQVGGNIGTALSSLVDTSRSERWNVLELSSFQLETIEHFHADISACLNITPDHLDRHHTLDNYVAAKRRLLETQRPEDFAVLNFDDPVCRSFGKAAKAQLFWFSASQPVPNGMSIKGSELAFNGTAFMDRSLVKLRGLHNLENVLAATLIAHLAGASLSGLGKEVASFRGVEHRIEFVRSLDGVEFYNDSKATNVDAALKAIQAFENPLWVILGGKDKGSDYAPLRELLRGRASTALLIGAEPPYEHAAAPLIKKELDGVVPWVDCGEMRTAVQHARDHARSGDVVLLAPACASFDQFLNYEERGKAFKQIVTELF